MKALQLDYLLLCLLLFCRHTLRQYFILSDIHHNLSGICFDIVLAKMQIFDALMHKNVLVWGFEYCAYL